MHKLHPQLLSHRVSVHLGVDLQVLVAVGLEGGPGHGHAQTLVGVARREMNGHVTVATNRQGDKGLGIDYKRLLN